MAKITPEEALGLTAEQLRYYYEAHRWPIPLWPRNGADLPRNSEPEGGIMVRDSRVVAEVGDTVRMRERHWHIEPPWAWLLVVALLAAVLAFSACGEEGTPQATKAAGETPSAEKVPGVTDTEIVLGSHLPLSGLAAAWGST